MRATTNCNSVKREHCGLMSRSANGRFVLLKTITEHRSDKTPFTGGVNRRIQPAFPSRRSAVGNRVSASAEKGSGFLAGWPISLDMLCHQVVQGRPYSRIPHQSFHFFIVDVSLSWAIVLGLGCAGSEVPE
jgi:hypothetical protein